LSWTDRVAFSNILQIKKDFNIDKAVITGVFYGGDAELYSHYFKKVIAVDKDPESLKIARERLNHLDNITLLCMDSSACIKIVRDLDGMTLYYLDAHFFDKNNPSRWVVQNELKTLENTKCVIIIHDYDNGLGHLVYDNEHMGWNVVGELIQKVNPDFNYYTNNVCDVYNEHTIRKLKEIHTDKYILDALKYANSSIIKRDRGILYAVPCKLDLTKYQLKEGHG
jgi:16S rRNA G966 N2-methylase RsmD